LTLLEIANTKVAYMPKFGPHRTHPERAQSSADRGFQRMGRAIRQMRLDRGWTQDQLAQRILQAEGYDAKKQKAYNAKVSRREQGHPTTLRTLTGFALAFGYRNVWDWFADLFRDADLSESESALLAKFRETGPGAFQVVMELLQALQNTALAQKPGAARTPKRRDRPQ
jgi:transcriptional regulator with XRE-family HTH domain